jgi:hypothetical protein
MARLIAPRFEITVLTDKSTSDHAQVPAAGAAIQFYRAGATVSATVTVPASPPDSAVFVYDPGRVAVGDTVRIGTGPGVLTVSGVFPDHLLLTNSSGTSIQLTVGTRLVPTNNPPNAYMDPFCGASIGSALYTDPIGRAGAYLSSNRVDYDVVITGQPLKLYVDGAGVTGRSDQAWNDLRDFGGNLQAAIDALPIDGGTVFVPRGTWPLASGVVVNISNVTIVGEGADSVLRAATPNSYNMVTVNQGNFQLRDITLDGAATVQDLAGKSCLSIPAFEPTSGVILNVVLENATLTGAPAYGLWMQDVIIFMAHGCHFDANQGDGARIVTKTGGATTTQFTSCTFSRNGNRGCSADNVNVFTFRSCIFEGNKGGSGDSAGNGIDVIGCNRIEVLSSYFANPDTSSPLFELILLRNCIASAIDGCSFDGGAVIAKQPVQAVRYSNCQWPRLSNCVGANLGSYLAVFDSATLDGVEFANVEVGQAIPRMSCLAPGHAQRLVGMSRRGLSIPSAGVVGDLPTASAGVVRGAMAWVLAPPRLATWDGTDWRTVALM